MMLENIVEKLHIEQQAQKYPQPLFRSSAEPAGAADIAFLLMYRLVCIVRAKLNCFQHPDACRFQLRFQSIRQTGLRHLILDAEGNDPMEAGDFQPDGCTIGGHPDLEILDVPFQLRVSRDKRVAQIAHPEIRREAADILAHLEDALLDIQAGFLLVDPVDPAHPRHPR